MYSGSGRGEVACDQALRGALAAGREKEGDLATTSLQFEYLHRKSRKCQNVKSKWRVSDTSLLSIERLGHYSRCSIRTNYLDLISALGRSDLHFSSRLSIFL